MEQASQEFPPWLTLVESTITDANGLPIETQTTVLYLPLTYYGPSIPLNSDWTYGGLTSPASTDTLPTATPTTFTAPPTDTSISSPSLTLSPQPSISSSSPLSSQTSSQITSSENSTFSSSSVSSSESPASTAAVPSSAASNRGTNLAIILSSVFGALLLAFLLLIVCLCLRRRRRRAEAQVSFIDPLGRGYHNVNGDNDSNDSAMSRVPVGRQAGEGSPRGSGEERDSFLRSPRRVPVPEMSELGAGRRPLSTGSAVVATQSSGSTLQSGSTDTNSGFGSVVPSTLRTKPLTDEERGLAPVGVALTTVPAALAAHHDLQQRSGQIMTVRDLNRIGEEESVESESQTVVHNAPFHERVSTPPREASEEHEYSPLVPPQRLDPDHGYTPRARAQVRHSNSSSQRSSFPTDAEEDATFLTATRVQVGDLGPKSSNLPEVPPTGPSAWFAGLNWFTSSEANSRSGSRRQSYIDQVLADDDIESALLRPSRGSPLDRPISSISTGSGGSVYHDAASTMNSRSQSSVPLPSPSPLAPLPRAFAHANETAFRPNSYPSEPQSNNPFDALLDEPAPLPFSAPPSRVGGSQTAMHDRPWLQSTNVRPLSNPFLTPMEQERAMARRRESVNPQITIDLLEEAAPRALDNWKSIAGGVQTSSSNPRYTFGVPGMAHREDDHVSLTSMRSGHMSPSGSRSGSASSRGHALFGSNASSRGGSNSEGGHSAHSGGSRGPISPALSAFGPTASLIRPLPSAPEQSNPLRNPPFPQPPSAAGPSGSSLAPTMITNDTPTTATTHLTGSTVATSEPMSPKSSVFRSPWVSGLDREWVPM